MLKQRMTKRYHYRITPFQIMQNKELQQVAG
jgi:hypothetical protein